VEGREEENYLGWPLNEGIRIWGKIEKDLGCCFPTNAAAKWSLPSQTPNLLPNIKTWAVVTGWQARRARRVAVSDNWKHRESLFPSLHVLPLVLFDLLFRKPCVIVLIELAAVFCPPEKASG